MVKFGENWWKGDVGVLRGIFLGGVGEERDAFGDL